MEVEDQYVAFARSADPSQGVEVRVNFGLFAGREATSAEIDELARRLLHEVDRVSIVSEQHYEVSEQVEASVHQVTISLPPEQVPREIVGAARLEGKLVAIADAWASACIAERRTPV